MQVEVGKQTPKHWRHIVRLVAFAHKVDIHDSSLEVYFLNSEPAGQTSQTRYEQQFFSFGWNMAEAVAQSLGECLYLVVAVDRVEFLIQGYALRGLWHVCGRQQKLEVGFNDTIGSEILGLHHIVLRLGIKVGKLLGA